MKPREKRSAFVKRQSTVVANDIRDVSWNAAGKVAAQLGAVEHRVMQIDLGAFGGSALTDASIAVPEGEAGGGAIPVTYVPARNTIFLAFALAWAEVLHAHDIYIGVNAVDYSGYPDCRPEYIAAFGNPNIILCPRGTTPTIDGDYVYTVGPVGDLYAISTKTRTTTSTDMTTTTSVARSAATITTSSTLSSCR